MATNLPVNVRQELSKERASLRDRISGSTKTKITLSKDKKFHLPDGTVTDGPLEVVIVDFMAWNTFRDRPYKEGDLTPPACYAVGIGKNDDLVPAKAAPNKQSTACRGCINNEWDSHPTGAGKACKNTMRLAVVAGKGKFASSDASPMLVLEVSPGALKSFGAYAEEVARVYDTPPIGCVTEVFFDPNVAYQSLRFRHVEANPNLELHFSRREEAKALLTREPDVSSYVKPAAKGAKAPAAKAKK